MAGMNKQHPYEDRKPSRDTWVWLCASLGLACIPQFLHLSFWIPLLALVLIGWRYWITQKHLPLPPKWLLMILMAIITVGILITYETLIGLNAGVALLTLMLSLKTLESRTLRDSMISIFLGYFVILTNFFFDQEMYTAIYLVISTVMMTATLMTLNEGDQIIQRKEKIIFASSMLAQAIPFMVVLFFLFPRLPNPLWAMPTPDTSSRTGLSDQMSPGSISQLLQSNETAFRVIFNDQIPPNNQLYWRALVMWDFDGKTWTVPEFLPRHSVPLDGTEKLIDYEITLEPTDRPWLITLDVPVSPVKDAYFTLDHQLIQNDPITEPKRYQMRSMLEHPFNYDLSPGGRKRLLTLPENSSPRAKKLAKQWLVQANNNPRTVVKLALDYFRQQAFYYTLTPPVLNKDPIDQFLFETRQGFCEHYASSFVALMRHAGIPARVVAGYQGGEFNKVGNYLRISQADAHAWAEVWFDDQGWVRIDPTAAVSPERVEQGINAALGNESNVPLFLRGDFAQSWIGKISLNWDSVRFFWNNWVVFYDTKKQEDLLNDLGIDSNNIAQTVITLIAGLSIIVLLYLLIFYFQQRKRPRDETEKLYRQFMALMSKHGLHKKTHEGSADFAHRIIQSKALWRDAIHSFTQAYIASRYRLGASKKLIQQMKSSLSEMK